MFNIFKNKDEDNLRLAAELLDYFSLTTEQFSDESIKIIKQAKNKDDILDKVIELCINIKKSAAYLNIATAYKLKGIKYRTEVIKYYNKFLENPVFLKTNKKYGIQLYQDIMVEDIELPNIYMSLGNAYEGKYDFENALNSYKKSCKIDPSNQGIYCCIARIYSKMNKLDESINILKEAKNSKYYKINTTKILDKVYTDDTFIKVIDDYLNDYENKKKRGYIYRPRKKKIN